MSLTRYVINCFKESIGIALITTFIILGIFFAMVTGFVELVLLDKGGLWDWVLVLSLYFGMVVAGVVSVLVVDLISFIKNRNIEQYINN